MERIEDHIANLNSTIGPKNRTVHNSTDFLCNPKPMFSDYFFYCITVIGCFGVIGNILTAVILLKNETKSITILLICLVTSDTLFIVILTAQSYYLTFNLDGVIWSLPPLQLQPLIGISSGIAAIIGFERSIATLLPFWYKKVWTKTKTVISVVPLVLINYGIVVIKGTEVRIQYDAYIRLIEQLVTRYLPGTSIFFTNILISVAMIKYSRTRKETLTVSSKNEMKITRMMFVVIVVFFICMLPGSVVNMLIDTSGYPPNIFGPVILISQSLEVINASCNFVIYVTTSKFYRREYIKLLTCYLRK